MKQPNEVPPLAEFWHEGDHILDPAWYYRDGGDWFFLLPKLNPKATGRWCLTVSPPSEMRRIDGRPNHSVDAAKKVTGQKFDQGKPMMSLIPPRAEMAVSEVLTFGANKYGKENWRHVDDLGRRYTDAARRHINAYQQGEQLDDESGLPHLAHTICCLMFILETDLEKDAPTR